MQWCDKVVVVARLQPEVDKVARVSSENGSTHNTSKSEVAFLTMDKVESVWCSVITLAVTIQHERNPYFFGAKYDCQLIFSAYVRSVSQTLPQRSNLLKLMGNFGGW